MEAIGLLLSKFSDELLSAQVALVSLALAVSIYWMLVRKKKRESAEWVPAALVRAYLDRARADERETRFRLFGEESAPAMPLTQMLHSSAAGAAIDPTLQREVEALRTQLASADSRAMEFDRTLNGIRAEKAGLEQKLKEASAAGGAPGAPGAPDPAVARELEDLRARIQEYDVVSEEIANIKILQKENEKLKQRIGQLEAGGPALTVVPGGQPVAAPAAAAVKPAEPAPVAPAPVSQENTNVLAPTAAAAPEKSSKQKEEELLSEFEKMLAS